MVRPVVNGTLTLLVLTSAACTADRVAGPAPRTLPPDIRRTLEASGVNDGMVALMEGRDSAGATFLVAGVPVHGGDTLTAFSEAGTQPRVFTVHPNGGYPGAFSRRQIPGLTPQHDTYLTFYCNITHPDGTVQRLVQKSVFVDSLVQRDSEQDSGGHGARHPDPKPYGSWEPRTGLSHQDGRFPTRYTSSIASGEERILLFFTNTEAGSPCEGNKATTVFRSAVELQGLVPQPPDNSYTFDRIDSDHTSIYYVRPWLRPVVLAMGRYYHESFGRRLRLSAASLPWGGINDVNFDWTHPHRTHRVGTDMDINGPADNQAEFRRLIQSGKVGGFKKCDVHNGNHVHCYGVQY